MDFYLTEIKAENEEGDRLQFPMNPEEISLTTGIITQDYSILSLGEVRMPSGNKLDTISWEGKLPGEARSKMSFVKAWKNPAELFKLLKRWQESGTTLHLEITETPIDMRVFIEEINPTFRGGMGDIEYKITLTETKALKVYTEGDTRPAKSETGVVASISRPTKPKSKTYTVKTGDTLWKIAQKELGKGSRYTEIVALSTPPLGNDPNKIYPGQVLTLPQ